MGSLFSTAGGMSLVKSLQNAKDMEDVRDILSTQWNKINRKDEADFTPLMWASKENHLQILIALLEFGADINAQTENGTTALMWAICWGHLETVKLLVRWGADINFSSALGHSPLIISIKEGHPQIAHFLLDEGANVNHHSNGSVTALMCAILSRDGSLIWRLHEAGADVNVLTREGKSAYDYAVENGMVKEYCAYFYWQQRKPFLKYLYGSSSLSLHNLEEEKEIDQGMPPRNPSLLSTPSSSSAILQTLLQSDDLTRYIAEFLPYKW